MSNVPKLRFKEFSGEWEEKTLKELTKINQGLQIPISDRYLEQVENSFFYITNEFLKEGSKNKYFIKNPPESVLCKEEDILMTRTGNTGQVVTNVIGAFHNNFFKIKYSKDLDKDFLVEFLRLKSTQNMILRYAGTSTIPDLNHGDFYRLKLNLPEKREQEKIALFLTSVDTKIGQLTKKEALLQEYKKGVMNKIFNQEIRFKDDDGSNFPEWEEKRLNKLTKIYDGTHSTPNYVEKGIPFYSVEHVTANQFENTKYITEEVFEKENKRVKLEKNDILMTRIGDIGTSRLIDWDVNASFYVSLALIKANKSFCSSYLNQYIKSNYFQKQLHSKTLHVAFPKKINLGEIGECIVLLPNIQEQIKISNFLSLIEKKIENAKNKLKKIKELKVALLQQMFV